MSTVYISVKDRIIQLRPHVPADKQKLLDSMLEKIEDPNNSETGSKFMATLDKWEFLFLD